MRWAEGGSGEEKVPIVIDFLLPFRHGRTYRITEPL